MPTVLRSAAAAILAATLLTSCTGSDEGQPPDDDTITATPTADSAAPQSTEPADPVTSGGTDRPGPPRVVKAIATGLTSPWGLAFLPNGDAVVTERDTERVLLLRAPSYDVTQAGTIEAAVGLGDSGGEAGLLGVAVSPDFASDRLLYFYFSSGSDNRIVKAELRGGRLGTPRVIVEGIPQGSIHDGGRLAFGPDGFLYASTGEAGNPDLAQDRSSLGGKILRMTTDGDPAPGNPFDSLVWTWGHRNVQGLAFDDDGRLWASEFGSQTWDELNLIEKGDNYGWPAVEGRGDDSDFTNPQVVWPTDVASPSGLAWLDGHVWMASLRGERLWRVDVSGKRASDPADFFVGRYGRMRTVAVAPDGRLWVMTSNTDGRGFPNDGDDKILLIDP
ncbi:PQQ-dependent sugar dehydrogenase [Nocardioides caricicola]|uniref:PQQ-dependent sugar dehydrogenase n=1 Tax=Nocardioides caricicola TaxID=634770 RepID=A0ABW0N491_9ACTN